jgi:hypothetical protein
MIIDSNANIVTLCQVGLSIIFIKEKEKVGLSISDGDKAKSQR